MSSEFLQTNERAFRTCILYEYFRGKPVKAAYDHMKKVMPNIRYYDFEYWYYRFSNGKQDLDHDRSLDPKMSSFSDMPIDVVEKIVRKLHLVDRLITRKVCRSLRTIVDQQGAKWSALKVHFGCRLVAVIRSSEGILVGPRAEKKSMTSKEDDGLGLALKDLSIILFNPNWIFRKFDFDFDSSHHRDKKKDTNAERLVKMISASKIQVKELDIKASTLVPVLSILPCFDSTTLESIGINCDNMTKELMDKVREMDHWKNVKLLNLYTIPGWFQLESLFHAPDFTVKYCEITRERLVKIRDVLFTNPTFKSCSLSFNSRDYWEQQGWNCHDSDESDEDYEDEEPDYDLSDLIELVEEVMSVHGDNYNPRNRQYRVKDTNEYCKIICKRNNDLVCLLIKRKIVHE